MSCWEILEIIGVVLAGVGAWAWWTGGYEFLHEKFEFFREIVTPGIGGLLLGCFGVWIMFDNHELEESGLWGWFIAVLPWVAGSLMLLGSLYFIAMAVSGILDYLRQRREREHKIEHP